MPRQRNPLATTIIGAGRVGSALAHLLHRKGYPIVSVISRGNRSARALARGVRSPIASTRLADIDPHSVLIVLAVPEPAITSIAGELAALPTLMPGRLTVAHTAGALTSDALSPLVAVGARGFSLHPIQTFPLHGPVSRQLESMKGIWYGFEGPRGVRPFARSLVKDLGGRMLEVPKDRKNLYHIACVFASNYPMVLVSVLETLGANLGMKGLDPFKPLIQSSIRNAQEFGAIPALTGPLVRGSLDILERHVEDLSARDQAVLGVYTALGLYAVTVLRAEGRISDEQASHMASILKNP